MLSFRKHIGIHSAAPGGDSTWGVERQESGRVKIHLTKVPEYGGVESKAD